MFHPPVAWSLVCSTSMCSLYNMLMWKSLEIIASYYITVAAYLMCFLMLRGTESAVPLIAATLLQILDCRPSLALNSCTIWFYWNVAGVSSNISMFTGPFAIPVNSKLVFVFLHTYDGSCGDLDPCNAHGSQAMGSISLNEAYTGLKHATEMWHLTHCSVGAELM